MIQCIPLEMEISNPASCKTKQLSIVSQWTVSPQGSTSSSTLDFSICLPHCFYLSIDMSASVSCRGVPPLVQWTSFYIFQKWCSSMTSSSYLRLSKDTVIRLQKVALSEEVDSISKGQERSNFSFSHQDADSKPLVSLRGGSLDWASTTSLLIPVCASEIQRVVPHAAIHLHAGPQQ